MAKYMTCTKHKIQRKEKNCKGGNQTILVRESGMYIMLSNANKIGLYPNNESKF